MKNMTIFFVCFLVNAFLLCNASEDTKQLIDKSNVLDLSIISLFGNSEKYYGQLVRTVGYMVVHEYESAALLPSACFYDNDYTSYNAISIGFLCRNCKTSKEKNIFYEKLKLKYHKKYVLVEGVFDKSNSFRFPFKITKVKRFEIWERPDKNQILF